MKGVLAVALLVAAPAAAEYPERPIRFIVPQAAGSATDNVVRLLDRKSTRLNSSHSRASRMPSSA